MSEIRHFLKQIFRDCLSNGEWSISPIDIACVRPDCDPPSDFELVTGNYSTAEIGSISGFNDGDTMQLACNNTGFIANTDQMEVQARARKIQELKTFSTK